MNGMKGTTIPFVLMLLLLANHGVSFVASWQFQPPSFSLLSANTGMGMHSEAGSAWHHFWETFPQWHLPTTKTAKGHPQSYHYHESVQDLANLEIPRRDGGTVLAYQTTCASSSGKNNKKLLILLHEFFGLSQSICDKADALANDLQCTVIAPDTFRGESSTFIPKCIWLALSTPQDRVNADLDDVLQWYTATTATTEESKDGSTLSLAVMGFCYGGGKAIRYTTHCQPSAATVVCYGSPLTDVDALKRLKKPVCGIFGQDDLQFPPPVIQAFERALQEAQLQDDSTITVYPNVGHAFWKDMQQIEQKQEPQISAYQQVVGFLKEHL
ncbi:sirohydrochlorin [Seminavis robusta]|uniref:Sirohydrochlorin n=1 Tax=Seminavis robusta TaxID=568900 RepID=A0A9N8DX35_9STRA|nr:sirohydrochlorin [Seminavis robusta]|eukprot:Sro338_g120810.1 sirohydrochlorin (327) ;mRNA; f:17429-18409